MAAKFDLKTEERERGKILDRVPGYHYRRGKLTPRPAAAWGMVGGDSQEHDADRGKSVLDEALGD
jgi:hypothetical protein